MAFMINIPIIFRLPWLSKIMIEALAALIDVCTIDTAPGDKVSICSVEPIALALKCFRMTENMSGRTIMVSAP